MSLAKTLLEFYALWIPYHAGKWRVVEALIRAGGIDAEDAGKSFIVSRSGLRWRLNPQCHVQRRLLYHGEFDRNDFRELSSRLPASPVFLDIGAYFGYYALKVRQAHGPGAVVHAFEPFPRNFALLEEDRALNGFGDVHIHRAALSDRDGTVAFEVPPCHNGGIGHIARADAAGGEVVQVNCTTLDRFVAQEKLARVDGIKLDVEGAELSVIEGGAETLKRFRPVLLMEYNPPCLNRLGTAPERVLERLADLGYGIFRATRSGLRPFCGLLPGECYINVFCIPQCSA